MGVCLPRRMVMVSIWAADVDVDMDVDMAAAGVEVDIGSMILEITCEEFVRHAVGVVK